MLNNDLRYRDVSLFTRKLDILLKKLRVQYEGGFLKTHEDVIAEFLRVIRSFYSDLKKPLIRYTPVRKDTLPSITHYNNLFIDVDNDLNVIFGELNHLETIVLRNFNYMVSERDKINKILKRVNSKVGDYVLYSQDPLADLFFFKDSFNDTSKIDFGTELLKEPQCELSQTEGIITLPVIHTGASTVNNANVVINNNSNGSSGNYQEIGAAAHDDIDTILDNNPDTWFEYERVQLQKESNNEPLRLDLTLYFNNPAIVNFIKINPNNFGTQTPVTIKSIDTSFDGNVWVSIKDDIPISDFLQEDEENVFTLASSTSKYSGQGLYTFTPRKVKYVHILLEQKTPYLIDTSSGKRWRYAIGIRDIELHAIKYQTKGDIISQPFISTSEIQKVTLLASENPIFASELADIKHQVSPDDGATWYAIQPQDRVGTEIPEILNFNTSDENSISTAGPVYTLRHRMLLTRVPEQFQAGSSTLRQMIKTGADILDIPRLSPATLQLTRPPINGTETLLNPLWGSRSRSNNVSAAKHILGASRGVSGMQIALPQTISDMLQDGRLDKDDVIIWIDNDPTWERVGNWDAQIGSPAAALDEWSKVYTLDIGDSHTPAKLQFGNGEQDQDTRKGMVPSGGSYIAFSLVSERLTPTSSSPHTYELLFPSDGEKKNFRIYREEASKSITGEAITPGATVHRLAYKKLVLPTVVLSGTFTDKVTYIDGKQEFTADNQYSVDDVNGIIYTRIPPTNDSSITVNYSYIPVYELTESDWDFVDTGNRMFQKIAIKETGYAVLQDTDAATYSVGDHIIDFDYQSIVPGSITGITSSLFTGTNVVPFEVKFINGKDEFPTLQGDEDNIDGYYSVDYENGKMYLAGSVGTIQTLGVSYTRLYAEYNIAKILDNSEYTVDTAAGTVSISEREMLKVWGDRDSEVRRDSLLKVIYDYVETTRESIEELEPYFTPIVREYVLKILPKGIV